MDISTVAFLAVIVGGCVWDWFLLANSKLKFIEIEKEFKNIRKKESSYNEKMETKGDIESESHSVVTYDRSLLEENRNRFNKAYAKYVTRSQMISLFPLLGILGTVFGLMFNKQGNDINQMLSGLDTALYTTFAGLIASIVLKAYDAANTGQKVNVLDSKFNEVDGAIERLTLEKILSHASKERMD